MFQDEQQLIEDKIKAYAAANDIPLAELKWQPIPFSGEWGVSTSFFQTAANEARASHEGRLRRVPHYLVSPSADARLPMLSAAARDRPPHHRGQPSW